jgi:hypothetical protein
MGEWTKVYTILVGKTQRKEAIWKNQGVDGRFGLGMGLREIG